MPDQDNNRVGYSHAFPQHEIDRADNPAALISEILRTLIGELLKKYPAADLTTLRFDLPEHPGLSGYRTARVRAWLKPAGPDECPSCHAHAGHAHTDYCQALPAGHNGREAMPTGRERPGEHWNARIIREDAEASRARSIHPDRGPVCTLSGCDHVYEAECIRLTCEHNHDHRPPIPVPVHRCTDPTCPIHGAHGHAGNDVLMRHPWCTCAWLEQWRTWPGQPHRPGCPVLTHPPAPSTPPTP